MNYGRICFRQQLGCFVYESKTFNSAVKLPKESRRPITDDISQIIQQLLTLVVLLGRIFVLKNPKITTSNR